MMKKAKTGRSARTPFKHSMLNAVVGAFVGALLTEHPYMRKLRKEGVTLIDMCAGDAIRLAEDNPSSPEILIKHAVTVQTSKYGIDIKVVLIEKDEEQFKKLKINATRLAEEYGLRSENLKMLNKDASDFVPTKKQTRSKRNRFLHIDPNTAAGVPTPETWDGWLKNGKSFVLMTLACNPGGLKRLPLKDREKWYGYVETVQNNLPDWFDMFAIPTTNDSHQFFWLLTIPNAWQKRMKIAIARIANKKLPDIFTIDVFSYKTQRKVFFDCVDQHFKTRKEYNQ